jgi:hypothetical protein
MRFIVGFGHNVFTLDIRHVTNADYVSNLINHRKSVSDIDLQKALIDPDGTHAFGTLERCRSMVPDATVNYAT